MDNGHTTSPVDPLATFTPDSGANSFDAKDNLDLTNQAEDWDQVAEPIEHDKKSLGNTAMNTPIELSMPPSSSEQSVTPVLGEVTENTLEPNAARIHNQPTDDLVSDIEAVEASLTPNLDTIKTTDRLSEESVRVIDSSIDKFNQNNIDPASFYEEVRNAMETNIENSYNRKLRG